MPCSRWANSTMATRLLTPWLSGLALGLVVSGSPGHAAAQSELALEFGGSQIGPPVGIEGEIVRYLMAGLRGSTYADNGSGGSASVLFGRTLDDSAGGSFLSGVLEASLVDRWTPSVRGALDARLLGYGARTPYPYHSIAAEGGPSLHVRTARLGVDLEAVGGIGTSQIELFLDEDGPRRTFQNDLWRYGARGEVAVGPVTSNLGVTGGWHRTPAGDYANVGGRFVVAGAWGVAELRIDRWTTPTATETTGGLALAVPLGALWSLRGFFGRTDPDPLTLAQPGSRSGGVLVAWSVAGGASHAGSRDAGLVRVVEYGEASSRVRLTLDAPESAAVAVTGDFTLWEPVAMTWDGEGWSVELAVNAGTHHFGFLIDDEWHVPDDAPDVVPDEWGRLTATLVIEGGPS